MVVNPKLSPGSPSSKVWAEAGQTQKGLVEDTDPGVRAWGEGKGEGGRDRDRNREKGAVGTESLCERLFP